MPIHLHRSAGSIALAVPAVALIAGFLAAAPLLVAQQPSPYAGLESRPIKALSAEEIERYLDGEGMGLAMAAELNDYPGPKHVLELAAELELTGEQRRAVQESYDAMHAEAVRLGEEIVERERRLDAMFAEASVTGESLRRALGEIGSLQAELRGVHLEAHLETRRLLTPAQIERYAELRGYAGGGGHSHGGDGHEHGHQHGHPHGSAPPQPGQGGPAAAAGAHDHGGIR